MPKPRPFTVYAGVSLAVCLGAATLWCRSHNHQDSCQYTTSPYKPVQHLLSLGSCDGRVSVCLNAFYSPNLLMGGDHGEYEDWGWRLSSSRIGGANDREHWMTWSPDTRFGFYASFTHDEKGAYRDIYVPYYLFVLGGGAAACVWGARRWRSSRANRRSARGLCPNCAYDLRHAGEMSRMRVDAPIASAARGAGKSVRDFGSLVNSCSVSCRRRSPILAGRFTRTSFTSAIAGGNCRKADVGNGRSRIRRPDSGKGEASQWGSLEISSKGIDYLLRCLGDGVNVIYTHQSNRFAMNSPKMETVEVVQFSDLRPQISGDLFDEVRLIHLSPRLSDCGSIQLRLFARLTVCAWPARRRRCAMKEYQHLIKGDWNRDWRYDLDEERILLIARLLFVRPGNDPPLASMEDGSAYENIKPNAEWPFLPLVVQDDIPFCLKEEYFDAPGYKSVSDVLDYCDRACSLRQTPLCPDVLPLIAADRLFGSDLWRRHVGNTADVERLTWMLQIQAMWAVTDLMKWHRDEDWSELQNMLPESRRTIWSHLLHDDRLAGVHWDPVAQKFVRTGSSD